MLGSKRRDVSPYDTRLTGEGKQLEHSRTEHHRIIKAKVSSNQLTTTAGADGAEDNHWTVATRADGAEDKFQAAEDNVDTGSLLF